MWDIQIKNVRYIYKGIKKTDCLVKSILFSEQLAKNKNEQRNYYLFLCSF